MARASFTGEHPLKIDAKGRMSIPADFRRVLEENDPDWGEGLYPRLYLLYGPHLKDHLKVYSVAAFDQITADIESMHPASRERKIATATILKRSKRLDTDKDGRIVMPQRQREAMGLLGDLMLAGAGDHFEIWDAAAYDSADADLQALIDGMGEDFDPMSLLSGGPPPTPPQPTE